MKNSRSLYGLFLVLLVVGAMFLTGCASPQAQQRKGEIFGTAGGAAAGGVIGGAIGNNWGEGDNEAMGAIIGAMVGGALGNQMGKSQDMTRQRIEYLESQGMAETVVIQNSNGSTQPVMLLKIGNGQYRGPRGEIYPYLPTPQQLQPIYGF